jgi:hypothetical protein
MTSLSAKTSEDHYKKSKRIFGSFDPKHYDEIITKLSLQTKEGYKHNTMQYLNDQRIQGEGKYCWSMMSVTSAWFIKWY